MHTPLKISKDSPSVFCQTHCTGVNTLAEKGFFMISGPCGHGSLTIGTLGFGDSLGRHILTRFDLENWRLISAHAPSDLEFILEQPICLKGFLSGSASCAPYNPVEFWINHNFIGRCMAGTDETGEIFLEPGKHRLEAVCRDDLKSGRHSCWALRKTRSPACSPAEEATSDNVAVVTMAVYPRPSIKEKIRTLAWSARKKGIWLHVYEGSENENYSHAQSKTLRRLEWLRRLPDRFRYILFVDGRDVVFCHGLKEICQRFEALGQPLVIGAEKQCFPEVNRKWADLFPPHSERRRWINSGLFMGRRDAVLGALEKLQEIYHRLHGDDATGLEEAWRFRHQADRSEQFLWQVAHLKQFFPLHVDSDSYLFANVTTEDLRIAKNTVYDFLEDRIRLKSNGNEPSVLHFSGPGTNVMQQWASYLRLLA
jgi:hypothetical protein